MQTTKENLTTQRREFLKIPDSKNKVVFEGGQYTIVDKKGNPISKTFCKISEFTNGVAVATCGNRKTLVNTDGTILIEKYYEFIKIDGNVVLLFDDGKIGFAGIDGTVYSEPIHHYSNISNFVNGMAVVTSAGKMNVINSEGKLLLKRYYSSVGIDGNIIRIYSRGKFGFANAQGKVICEPNFKFIEKFNKGFARFLNDENKWGVINEKGKIILEAKYTYVSEPGESEIVAKRGCRYGVVDFKGNVIKPFKYAKVSKRDGKTVIFNTEEDGYTVTDSYTV